MYPCTRKVRKPTTLFISDKNSLKRSIYILTFWLNELFVVVKQSMQWNLKLIATLQKLYINNIYENLIKSQ